MQRASTGVRLVRMEEMEQSSEGEYSEGEEERYEEYEAAVYAARQGGRMGQKAGGEASRIGPKEPARVEKRAPGTQRQEDLRRKVEAQLALPKAKAPRNRDYGAPLEQDMELDPMGDAEPEVEVEVLVPDDTARAKKRAPPQKRALRNDLAELSPAETIFQRLTSERTATVSLAELASVSPAFKRYLYGRAGQTGHAGQQEEKASPVHARNTRASPQAARGRNQQGETEYAAESGLIPAVINGVTLYPTGDNGSEINRMGWSDFLSLGLPYDDEVDWTMTGITGDAVPLSCCIHKASISIGGVVVDTPIFASPGVEGEFILGRPFERESLLQWDNRADGSMWGTVTSSDGTKKARFQAVKPGGYSRTFVREPVAEGSWMRSKGKGQAQ